MPPGWPTRVESLEARTLLSVDLLADLNYTTPGTGPTAITPVGTTAYFVRNTNELWKSDGTVAGSSQVARLGSTIYPITGLTPLPNAGLLVFEKDLSVYRTDGTAAGTSPLAKLNAAPRSYYTDGSRVFWYDEYTDFFPNQQHRELWFSDGTAAGTRKVVDFVSDLPGVTFLNGAFNNGTFYFLARTGQGAAQAISLWSSDGTAAGTRKITDTGPTDTYNYFGDGPRLLPSGGKLFIVQAAGESGGSTAYNLIVSDGTAAGTRAFASVTPSPFSTLNGQVAVANGRIYYRGNGGSLGGGIELWSSDGTAAGTAMVKDIVPGRSGSYPDDLTPVGNSVYFNVRSNTASTNYDQLWRSDGTPAGTVQVAAVSSSDGASQIVGSGGRAYYRDENQLWTTDGTPGAATQITAVKLSQYPALVPFSDGLLVLGDDAVHGNEMWFTPGTNAGTRVIDLTTQTLNSYSGYFADLAGKAFFAATPYLPVGTTAYDGQIASLMTTDGTAAGTTIVRDYLYVMGPMVRSGNRLYFPGWGGGFAGSTELWATDGTTNGTRQVKRLDFTSSGSNPQYLTDVNGTLYFVAKGNLWRSDGTEAGTVQVSNDLTFFSQHAAPPLMAIGNTLYFVAASATSGPELYKLDVGAGGVPVSVPSLVKDVRPGVEPSNPIFLGALDGRLLFTAADDPASPYRHLWSTDGTPAGTRRLGDTATGPAFLPLEYPSPHAALFNGLLYFAGGEDTPDEGLWKTDGTAAGTVPVLRRPLGVVDVYAGPGRLYVVAGSNANGVLDLLASDGTAAGTVALHQFERVASPFVQFGDRTFFEAKTPAYGWELWSTDGTAAGTHIEADLMPGAADGVSPYTQSMAAAGGMLLLAGKTPQHGDEPRKWVAGGAAPAAVVAGRYAFYNNSAADGFNESANAADDDAIAQDKSALLPGQQSNGQNRTSFSRGMNGIMVDLAGLPAGASLTAGEFVVRAGVRGDPADWRLAAEPQVSVRRGAGAYNSDRVSLTWKSDAAPKNVWVQVTVKANLRTGLASPDVFYFGNLVGDIYNSPPDRLRVDGNDLPSVRWSLGAAPGSTDADLNRDGRVNVLDLAIARAAIGRELPALSPVAAQAAPAAAAAVQIAAVPTVGRSALRVRRTWYEPAAQ